MDLTCCLILGFEPASIYELIKDTSHTERLQLLLEGCLVNGYQVWAEKTQNCYKPTNYTDMSLYFSGRSFHETNVVIQSSRHKSKRRILNSRNCDRLWSWYLGGPIGRHWRVHQWRMCAQQG